MPSFYRAGVCGPGGSGFYNEFVGLLLPVLMLLSAAARPVGGESRAELLSARHKLGLIQADRIPAGGRVDLSPEELSAYARWKTHDAAPAAVHDARLVLGHGAATGSAWVDFMKLPQTEGLPLDWLLRKLLGGDRPVRVIAEVRSGAGKARVDVKRVEISGHTVEGATLDFLIRRFLLPRYPNAKIGEPFELRHRIDRLEVRPDGVRVVMKN